MFDATLAVLLFMALMFIVVPISPSHQLPSHTCSKPLVAPTCPHPNTPRGLDQARYPPTSQRRALEQAASSDLGPRSSQMQALHAVRRVACARDQSVP